jgi:hypothetical protein
VDHADEGHVAVRKSGKLPAEGNQGLMQPLGIPASVTDVDQLAIQVKQFASRRRLTVVPVIPVSGKGWGYLVLLDQHHLTAAQFCELAITVEAKLLYVKTDDFNARTDPGIAVGKHDIGEQSSPVSDQLIKFRRDVDYFNGRARQLELAFATGCVLHCWAGTADWYIDLVNRAAELASAKSAEKDRARDQAPSHRAADLPSASAS